MQRFKHAGVFLAGILTALTGCVTSSAPESRVALSYDGLTPVAGTVMSRVWVREGFSLAGYRKVMLVSAGIQFRPLPPQAETAASADRFQLSEAQKSHLQQAITEEFDKALDRLTLEEVSEPGQDVLLVRGTMLDVVSKPHDDPSAANGYRLDSIGQVTFMVEFIDSESNAVLVRAIDTRSARTPGTHTPGEAMDDTESSAEAGVRLVLARWASMLVDALNDLAALDLSARNNLQGA